MQRHEVFVVDAVRTPVGRFSGAFADVRPDDLGALAIKALLDRDVGLYPARIGEVYLGAANQAGEDNRNVARMSALLAGRPTSVPASTLNRLCASGLDAVVTASRAIAVGDASIMIAGGVESMTRAPWVLPKPHKGFPAGNAELHSTTLGWRMVGPAMPAEWIVSLGERTEILAEKYGITRDDADAFSVRSHALAAKAWADGVSDAAVLQVPGHELDRDEGIRVGVTTDSLTGLKQDVRRDGTVTAANASQLSDGAALLLADGLAELGAEPLARITASGVDAVDPQIFGISPVQLVRRALAKTGRSLSEVAVLGLNDTFAAQSLASVSEWPELAPARVNPLGGARRAGAVAHQLPGAGAGVGVGVAALCVGVGQGLAVTMER